jgi:hypothetical protein
LALPELFYPRAGQRGIAAAAIAPNELFQHGNCGGVLGEGPGLLCLALWIGAIDCEPVPMVEQTVGVPIGGRGSYVRDWKIVRLYAFDKFKLGAVRHFFVIAIRDREQAQTGPLPHGMHMVDRIVISVLPDNRVPAIPCLRAKRNCGGCDHGTANIASQLRKPGNGVPTSGLAYEVEPLETILPLKSIESGHSNTDFQ